MNNNYKDLDSLKIKNYAIEAKKLFPENDEIRLLADYLLFSELKVKSLNQFMMKEYSHLMIIKSLELNYLKSLLIYIQEIFWQKKI